MTKNKRINIIEDPIYKVLKELTIPMILGILGMVAFNLTDTYFVGKLGTNQIAALTFTFPVVLVINSLNLGIGIGASALISKAVGEKERLKVMRLSTDSIILGLMISIIVMIIGLLTIKPLFRLLGADENTLPYIVEYMQIWYIGVPFVVIPIVGNNVIRALGDTKTPSIILLVSASINIVFDPFLIMGIGFLPKLGVSGAALTTVIARAFTFVFALYILIIREKVVSLKTIQFRELLASWKALLFIGLPNAIAKMIIPFGTGVITGLIASYGTEAVAGYGIATKMEYFVLAVINALVAIIPVYVGQNFGAKKINRIKEGILSSEKFSCIYGIGIYIMLVILARPLARLFTDEVRVINMIVIYFRIVPIGYAFQGIVLIINGAFNALQRPIKAASVNLIQMLVIYIPLAIVTSKLWGIYAIFISLAISYLLVAVVAHTVINRDLKRL